MAQKYFKQDENLVIVDAAYKDGNGNNISSHYATDAALKQEVNDRKAAISEITGGGGLLSQYRKAADQDTIDASIASTAAENLKAHTDNNTIHLTATERTQWNAGYTHSQVAPSLTTVHHDVVSTKMLDEQVAVTGLDSTNLAAKYDFAGNSITATYATKTECSAKYTKPTNGIDTTDLANGVVASLAKADAAQPAIADLETIRSGAAAGATAVQPTAISDMATKSWVGTQGFITNTVDNLTNYSTTTAMNTAINSAISTATADMATNTGVASSYYNKTEVDNKFSDYSKTSAMNTAIATAVADEATARTTAISTAKSETQAWVEGKGYLTEHQDISGKVDRTIQTAAGKALVTNESDGGCIKFESSTNWSAVSANNGGAGIGAQAYNWKVNGSTLQEGSVIDVTQDKVYYYNGAYTSAVNRDIAGNEIARLKNIPTIDTLVTNENLTASVAVGAIPQGTTIPAGTSLSSLLKKIFEGTSTLNKFYYGTLKNLPTSDADIKAASTMTAVEMTEMVRADLQLGGYAVELTPNVDYIVFAIDKADSFKLQTLIVGDDFDEGDIATLADTATLRVYCLGDSDKQPMKVGDGTTQETYKFICGTN